MKLLMVSHPTAPKFFVTHIFKPRKSGLKDMRHKKTEL